MSDVPDGDLITDVSRQTATTEMDLGAVGKDVYMLTRDNSESQRLNSQHQLLINTVGFFLHPEIEQSLNPHAKIADIGTGTGIVPLDLATRLPSTIRLDGFDISSDQFPADLPDNVSLRVWDAKKLPPPHLRNRYDVIHLRYLNSGMGEQDWDVVTQNVLHMLKPGGYIQWLEADFGGARWLRNDPLTTAHVHEELHSIMRPQVKHWSYAPRALEDILKNSGFQNLRQLITSTDRIPEMRRAWSMVEIGAMEGFFPRLDHGFTREECTEKLEQLKKEAENDVYVRWNLHVWIGRKPLPN